MKALSSFLEQAAHALAQVSWQIGVLIVLVLAATTFLSRARPAVRYILWCAVLLRLCLPFAFHSPLGLGAYARSSIAEPLQKTPVNRTMPGYAVSNDSGARIIVSSGNAQIGQRQPANHNDLFAKMKSDVAQVSGWAWCGLIWLIGVVAFTALVLGRWFRLGRIAGESRPCTRPDLRAFLDNLRQRLGFRREITLLLLPPRAETLGPCTTGWRRPIILLPTRLAEEWDVATIEPILMHELAHIRRGDVLINALQVLTQIAYWFHPCVWFAHSRLRHERELICDDFAVLHTGGAAQRYGATVIRTLEEIRTAEGWSFAGVAMAESALASRLRRLLDRTYVLPQPLGRCAFIALALTGMLGILVASDTSPKKEASRAKVAPKATVPAENIQPPLSQTIIEFIERAARQERERDPHVLPVAEGQSKDELSGKVVDRHGAPVAGALVDAWDWYPGNETRTGADGTFRLTKLDPDTRVEVRFIKSGFAPYTVVAQPLGAMSAPVVLDEETCFEGVVKTGDGTPVPNAFIRANQGPKQGDGVQISTIWTETHSDADGRYRLRVQDDTYDLQVTTPSGMVARLTKVTIAPRQAVPLDLKVEPGVVFRARVLDSQTSEPVAGVRLHHWQHPGVEGTSNSQGELEIRGLIPGPFEFEIDAQAYARWWSEQCSEKWARREIENDGWQRNFDHLEYDLVPGMQPVTITVERAVRIRGRIIDPEGHAVSGATAAPALTGTANSLTGDTRFSVKTAGDGSFEMWLPASNRREYNLVAHDGDYQQWRRWANGVSALIKTTPGEQLEGVELRLNRPAIVRGRVVDAGGAAVADREVRAQAADLHENRYYDPTVRTDAEGKFAIKFIRPGKHQVQVAPFGVPPGNAPGESTRVVELAEGQILELPDLTAAAAR